MRCWTSHVPARAQGDISAQVGLHPPVPLDCVQRLLPHVCCLHSTAHISAQRFSQRAIGLVPMGAGIDIAPQTAVASTLQFHSTQVLDRCHTCMPGYLLLLLLQLLCHASQHPAHGSPYQAAHEAFCQSSAPLLPFPAVHARQISAMPLAVQWVGGLP